LLEFKKSYLQTLDAMKVTYRPEIRWMADPDDFVRPMVYHPDDDRWENHDKERRTKQLCH
jgi:hypothetical protein